MVTLSSLRRTKETQQGTSGLDSAQVSSIAGSGVSVYETLDSLPSTGLTAGDEAYVKSNNRLYISNGAGWYNTTLVNRTPRFDSALSATYEIIDSVTPLIVTARAVDSDNPDTHLINQSFASDSAQYMVDITIDSSVFTFTPKSADSIGIEVAAGNLTDSNGDFTYTFKWSDGVNFVSSPAVITYNTGAGGPGTSDLFAAIRISSGSTGQAYNLTQSYPSMAITTAPNTSTQVSSSSFVSSNTLTTTWTHNQYNHDAVKFVAADDIYLYGYLGLPQQSNGTWASKSGNMIQTGATSYVTGSYAPISGNYAGLANGWTYFGIQNEPILITAGTSMNVFLMNFAQNGNSLRTNYSYNTTINAPTNGTSFTISNVDSTTTSNNGTSSTNGYVAGIVYEMA